MAAAKTSRSVIDNLPEAERRKVVDALLAGETLSTVGKMVGISAVAVKAYKDRVIVPAIKAAQKVQAIQGIPPTNAETIQQQTALTRDIVRASPFLDRLEKLWERTDRALDKAETASELAVMPGLLNQGHKNLELLGRVTGELETPAQQQIAIQIVMPQAVLGSSGDRPDVEVVDIALPRQR